MLVAEDNPALAGFMAWHLERAGHEVTVADEGYAALRLAEEHDYDLLILDVIMPGLDGDIVARKVRELRPDARILFVTGSYGAHRVGGEHALFKPFEPGDLLAAVDELTG